MFGMGVPELVLILVIGLVVFGPGKLPEIGKAVGRSLKEFKGATMDAPERVVLHSAIKEEQKKEPEKIEPPKQEEK